jgi:hypothetical protein
MVAMMMNARMLLYLGPALRWAHSKADVEYKGIDTQAVAPTDRRFFESSPQRSTSPEGLDDDRQCQQVAKDTGQFLLAARLCTDRRVISD